MAENEEESLPGIGYSTKQLADAKQLTASSATQKPGHAVPGPRDGRLPSTHTVTCFSLPAVLRKWPDASAQWLLPGQELRQVVSEALAAERAAGRQPAASAPNAAPAL